VPASLRHTPTSVCLCHCIHHHLLAPRNNPAVYPVCMLGKRTPRNTLPKLTTRGVCCVLPLLLPSHVITWGDDKNNVRSPLKMHRHNPPIMPPASCTMQPPQQQTRSRLWPLTCWCQTADCRASSIDFLATAVSISQRDNFGFVWRNTE
jgi:hypothetical protein